MDKMEKIRKVKDKHEAELMKKTGVVGCAVGYKYVDGQKTDELCIVCYVKEKRPKNQLKKEDIIPSEIDGILTDVVESGSIRAL